MKLSTRIAIAATVLPLVIPAQASSIAITYSLTGTGTVVDATDTTLTLVGQFSGSVLSGDPVLNAAWNPVTYTDRSVADLTTGLLNGNFTLVFANGDTLSGNVFEDVSPIIASPDGTGPFTQMLSFTGGTGEFAGATGSASGNGFVGTTIGTVSGAGTLIAAAVPEPASAALLLGGLALIIAGRLRSGDNGAPEFRREL
ncbi:MAG: PEP-CTERM sorting domain-containing protein [Acidobacteriaceae bacterium]|nr:PEP-CTERM sorting domain-containing protein [Acidobacteriaceae bacterium]